MQHIGPWVPNFHSFRSTVIRFEDINAYFYNFPIDSHVKISKYSVESIQL